MEKAKDIIQMLLSHLPDADDGKGDDWEHCWDELSWDSQDNVKMARATAIEYLNNHKC